MIEKNADFLFNFELSLDMTEELAESLYRYLSYIVVNLFIIHSLDIIHLTDGVISIEPLYLPHAAFCHLNIFVFIIVDK